VKRRDFIGLLGGAAAWPLSAPAQPGERVRRIGVLTNPPENDPEDRQRMAAFLQALQKLGWREGDNLQIEYRRSLGKANNARKYAAELVALAPDRTEIAAVCVQAIWTARAPSISFCQPRSWQAPHS
jgi:putative tryptophan/tyrosine transport system substrate-binding protein